MRRSKYISDLASKMTAEQVIQFIASDYFELSYEKVKNQQSNWRQLCQDWLSNQPVVPSEPKELDNNF